MSGTRKNQVASCELRVAEKSLRADSVLAARHSLLATRRRPRRRSRRGVLLLVVLSLLVLFLMIGTAFIITAKQADIAGKTAAKASDKQVARAATGNLLDDVLLQLLRDTDNPNSSLRTHSLLGDLYGDDGFKFEITNVQWAKSSLDPPADPNTGIPTGPASSLPFPGGVTGGQMIQFEVNTAIDLSSTYPGVQSILDFYNAPFQPHGTSAANAITRPSQVDGAYNGRILTFLTGPSKGISTRIVDYHPITDTRWQFTVLTVPLADGTILADAVAGTRRSTRVLEGSRVLVNGAPFNGTGVGLNPIAAATDPKLDAGEAVGGLKLTFGSNPVDPPIALLPNMRYFNPSNLTLPDLATPATLSGVTAQNLYFPRGAQNAVGRGGSDETYDAADFQNMFLAVMHDDAEDYDARDDYFENPDGTPTTVPTPAPSTLGEQILPSFHRPELLHFWAKQLEPAITDFRESALATNPLLLRKILLRPNWLDHPLFTGSNPQLPVPGMDAVKRGTNLAHMIYGPWDVDNDNDGVRDSVWIDAGLPVVMGPNGKLVKPLVAMLVIDMDGRLNVNAHGSADLADAIQDVQDTVSLAGGEVSDETPRGTGWGPADISLEGAIGQQSFRDLFGGRPIAGGGGTQLVPGRVGRDRGAGRESTLDLLPQITQFGWPQWGRQAVRSTFGLPPDLRARYSGTGLNNIGQVVYEADFDRETRGDGPLVGDSPYEASYFPEGFDSDNGLQSLDAPFSLGELERILRAYDSDMPSLPERLAFVSGTFSPDPSNYDNDSPKQRNRITTDSWDSPAPNFTMPKELETLLAPPTGPQGDVTIFNPATGQPYRRLPQSFAELLEARVRFALNLPLFPRPLDDNAADHNDPTKPPARLRIVMRQLLAPEIAAGLRLNVNRPFGNGRDDNQNGVVDEPGEDGVGVGVGTYVGTSRQAWAPATGYAADNLAPNFLAAPFEPLDVTFDGDPNPGQINDTFASRAALGGPPYLIGDSWLQRQLLARHLYVMALAVTADAAYTGARAAGGFDDPGLARRMAQWAVNVVDFRDADGAMTPFEYDVNPFDGWNVNGNASLGIDGDLRTVADHVGPDGVSDPSQPNSLLDDTFVWGAERPDLLITETLAWHDRRTEDSGSETDVGAYPPSDVGGVLQPDPFSPKFEPDNDQKVRPRGAAFIELYNPWSPMPGADGLIHRLLPDQSGQLHDMGVNLQAVDSLTKASPVWRLAVYKRGAKSIDEAGLWDPDDRAVTGTQFRRPSVPIDRTVYFTGFDPQFKAENSIGWDADGVAYFADPIRTDGADPRTGLPILRNVGTVRPGRYLVVGSGDDTENPGAVYSSIMGDRFPQQQNATSGPAQRRVDLIPRPLGDARQSSAVRYNDDNNVVFRDTQRGYDLEAPSEGSGAVLAVPGDTRTDVADVAVIDHVYDVFDNYDDRTDKADGLKKRRFTLSEPARGYIDIFRDCKFTLNPGGGLEPQYQPAIDIPLDGPINDGQNIYTRVQQGGNLAFSRDPTVPFPVPEYLRASKTSQTITIDPALIRVDRLQPDNDPRVSYAFIYLQRLANPTLPWNPEPGQPGYDSSRQVNPYMTIDGMSANITVFNGRQIPDGQLGGKQASQEEDGTVTKDPTNAYSGVQKFASLERGFPVPGDTRIRSLWRRQPPSKQSNQLPLNRFLGSISSRAIFNRMPTSSLGFLNVPFQLQAGGGPAEKQLVPDAAAPVQWFPWNDRPYVSGNELLLVPRVRASQLLYQFSAAENFPAPDFYNLAAVDKPVAGANAAASLQDVAPYAQLENFLLGDETGNNPPPPQQPKRLYRLLDFIGTPSRYAGATEWFNPATVGSLPPSRTGLTVINAYDDPRMDRQAPFNNVAAYREPGRVNINTIVNSAVYAGIFHDDDDDAGSVRPEGDDEVHPGPRWDDGPDSFVRSRRGYGPENPDLDMLALDPAMPTFFANPFRSSGAGNLVPLQGMVRADVECTMARSTSATAAGIDERPLFSSLTIDPYRNAQRNPYFHFAPMVRLNNLTTTRSNVFAVWLTVGFFEVKEAPTKADFGAANGLSNGLELDALYGRVYPDGYQFTTEDGLDEGEVRRLRGFYIIDRSRAAGFIPGQDINAETTIRLHRRIE
jgi:hypothetical protein